MFFTFFKSRKTSAKKVSEYYDEWTDRYLESYGETIQAYRPESDEEFFDALIKSIVLKNGMNILDAGCGVCGPSIYFANKLKLKIEAISISAEQVRIASEKIKHNNIEGLNVQEGDFHNLRDIFPINYFDKIFFLESLGYAHTPDIVIESAFKLLKPGGQIYIKDFYPLALKNSDYCKLQKNCLNELREIYKYNILDFSQTIQSLHSIGFKCDYIKKPSFSAENDCSFVFERQNGIVHLEKQQGWPFEPYEWLEMLFTKPFDS